MGPLKYLSNFWRTPEMSLINCETNTSLTWSEECIIVTGDYGNEKLKFSITVKKTLCSSCDFISSRKQKIIAAIKIKF